MGLKLKPKDTKNRTQSLHELIIYIFVSIYEHYSRFYFFYSKKSESSKHKY